MPLSKKKEIGRRSGRALKQAHIFFDNLAELCAVKARVAAVIRGSDGKPFATGYSDLQIKDAYDKTHTGRTRLEKDGPFRAEESHIYYQRCGQILDVASPDYNKMIEIDLYLDHDVGKPGVTPDRTLRLFQAPVMRREEL
ncbi:hypothetical protein [Rhizobium leguminosarum]|uniref:hypothetical protein n=1 Tax=Rhizobium leguminosarum TaxID=384 RepID=UPI001C911FED|nr:hypothetical protein [Rhizobium leguminosarum]MBY3044855.1 hypothetical protein [Rhizobium leguminosarum]